MTTIPNIDTISLKNMIYDDPPLFYTQIIGNGNRVTIKVPQSLLSITNPDLKVTIKAQGKSFDSGSVSTDDQKRAFPLNAFSA